MSAVEGVLTLFGIVWLISTGVAIVNPASFPAWAIDLANIIMWAGLIPIIIIGIVLLVMLVGFLIARLL